MKIYTRTGDGGSTGLFGGRRVSKASTEIITLGSIDKLNASLGVCISHIPHKTKKELLQIKKILTNIQNDLFYVGSLIAGNKKLVFNKNKSTELEKIIDEVENKLPPLKDFILPQGCFLSSSLHFTRALARESERFIVMLKKPDKNVLMYFNRLSDLLFVLARYANKLNNVDDSLWKKE